MEVHYTNIVCVELKRSNIYIPNEWPIQGIENLVLCLAEKIIMDPGPTTYILQVNNVPAKLNRHLTESGYVYVFQKVPYEDVIGSQLYDVVLPIDDPNFNMEIFRGENQCRGSWPNYCVTASPRNKKMSYYIMPPSFKKMLRNTGANDSGSRHWTLQRIKRTCKIIPECSTLRTIGRVTYVNSYYRRVT